MAVAIAQGCHANAGRCCRRGGHLIPFYLHCKKKGKKKEKTRDKEKHIINKALETRKQYTRVEGRETGRGAVFWEQRSRLLSKINYSVAESQALAKG